MTNILTLDEITAAADSKFANLEIPMPSGKSAILVNALQLPREARAELTRLQSEKEETEVEADTVDVLEGALRVAGSTTPKETDELISLLGGNLAKLLEVFTAYTSGTQAGEA